MVPSLSLLASVGLLISIIMSDSRVLAATIWCNPANSGKEDGHTKDTGYKTLWRSISAMSPGDTVIISNGDWSRGFPGMTIDNAGHLPPSGTGFSGMSTICAETDWKAKICRMVDGDPTKGPKYVKIQGLIIENEYTQLCGWSYCKIIRCAFLGKKMGGNNVTFGLSHGINNLVEECVAWGGGRYKFIDGGGHHNIWRRCVARHDWYIEPDWPGQESNFRGYGCHDSVWQNCISIDSDRVKYQNTDSMEDGDFWIGDQAGGGGNIIAGCIVMRGMYQAYYLGGQSPSDTIVILNSVALGPSLEGFNGLTGAVTYGVVNVDISNCLFYNFKLGKQHFISHNKSQGKLRLIDSIAMDVGRIGPMKDVRADHNCYIGVGPGNYGKHSMNVNPFKNGLLYPCRTEPGSALQKMGKDGGVCGPTILKKIGVSGTAYGETGWNDVTDEDLWPFPNETKIRELMRETVKGVSGEYGFCAEGETLTNYIWGYFGNAVPPFNVQATSGNGTVMLTWDPPADIALPTILGFNVYDVSGGVKILMGGTVTGNRTYSKTITGLANGRTYEFAVTATDKVKGESGYAYKVSVTPGKREKLQQIDKLSEKMGKAKEEKQPSETVSKRLFANKLGMEFIFIPSGTFIMGISSNEEGKSNSAVPHPVTLTKGFYLQTTEVTQGQWKELMGSNPSFFKECGNDCPVEQVSWSDVQQFIKRLNRKEGVRKYRLPTEAEWEYACRAETRTPFSFGRCLTTEQANYCGHHPFVGCEKGECHNKPIPVKSLSPNGWGLYDMHGNVWEWCFDRSGKYLSRSVTDPKGPSSGTFRIFRGGGWNSYGRACRSGNRSANEPTKRFANLGFRLAREP